MNRQSAKGVKKFHFAVANDEKLHYNRHASTPENSRCCGKVIAVAEAEIRKIKTGNTGNTGNTEDKNEKYKR